MVEAIVLAKVDGGKDKEVLECVKGINGVERVWATYGVYDLAILVYFQSVEALDKFVFHELRTIPSVRETVTLICSSFVT
jgi:DNA-binding Lrp family transcriptional regulator